MGLQDAFAAATKDWDAKKDSANQSDLIPAGTYQVMLDKTDHPVYKSGWDCLRFSMQVIKGKYASRKEQLRISLATKTTKGKPMPDFVLRFRLYPLLSKQRYYRLFLSVYNVPAIHQVRLLSAFHNAHGGNAG